MHVMWIIMNLNLYWQLSAQFPSEDVALITAGHHIKAVTNYEQVRRMMMIFTVYDTVH